MGAAGATGAGSGVAADRYRRRACACASSSPLRDRLAPARLTSRRLGEGAGEPLIVAAKSFDGKLLTPSLLSGRFNEGGRSEGGRAGASCISASFIVLRAALCRGWQAVLCWYTARAARVTAALHTA